MSQKTEICDFVITRPAKVMRQPTGRAFMHSAHIASTVWVTFKLETAKVRAILEYLNYPA